MSSITFGGTMTQISEELKKKISTLIPEDSELHTYLGNNNLGEVTRIVRGYYAMTDTTCRALQGASDEEKTRRPDLIEISEKWGPKYEELEEIFDELSAIKG